MSGALDRGMNNDKRTGLVARENIMQLLSEEEMASVSNAESATQLGKGDEYLDLEQLALGVRKAPDGNTPTSHMLPRKAVRSETWTKILAVLAAN